MIFILIYFSIYLAWFRFACVKAQDKCSCCGYPLMTRAFYVFPCQHRFHSDCLIAEVTFAEFVRDGSSQWVKFSLTYLRSYFTPWNIKILRNMRGFSTSWTRTYNIRNGIASPLPNSMRVFIQQNIDISSFMYPKTVPIIVNFSSPSFIGDAAPFELQSKTRRWTSTQNGFTRNVTNATKT